MDTKEYKRIIEKLFSGHITSHLTLEPNKGLYEDFPSECDPRIISALRERGVEKLYHHQAQAFRSVASGQDTLIVSKTASGKTLSFFLPIFNEYINSPQPFTVFLMYPTKALSRDQENSFGAMMSAAGVRGKVGTFDGDTPQAERSRMHGQTDFIITNPDMLHSGILPNHNRRWRTFLSRLRYIVIDEVHIYRGAFGSHVSNVLRRLSRICAIHGSNPVFICSSATIGNPSEHAKALTGKNFIVLDNDTAPRPQRDLYCVNPPFAESLGSAVYRKGPAFASIPLMREAVKRKIRTICFCRARQEVERLYRSVIDEHPDISRYIKPYRGGLLPNERRSLERDLSGGKLLAIITTNALELGIDIGDLDLCIMSGHPGTIASFWQQSGRAGRRDKPSITVYIAKDRPIDQFLVHHTDFLTKAPIENALLCRDNPYIYLQHLPCAAQEHPLRRIEPEFDEPLYSESIEVLRGESVIKEYHDTFRYALQDYASRGVNLRGMTDYNVDIYCGTDVIGEIDPIGARGSLYKDAIYHHIGTKYISMELDLEKKLCRVEPVVADYYTEAVWENRIEISDHEIMKDFNGAALDFGIVKVNIQPKLYKKIRERTYENIGYGPITLSAFEYETTGFCLVPPVSWTKAMESENSLYISAANYGLRYILRHAGAFICMADTNDIATDTSLTETAPTSWKPALYCYDTIEGGVGYSEKIFEKFAECLELCRTILTDCECSSGCPSCVPPLPPGTDDEELESFLMESNAATACTLSLIESILRSKIIIPEIKVTSMPMVSPIYDTSDERKEVIKKLTRSAKILQNKRERLH